MTSSFDLQSKRLLDHMPLLFRRIVGQSLQGLHQGALLLLRQEAGHGGMVHLELRQAVQAQRHPVVDVGPKKQRHKMVIQPLLQYHNYYRNI